MDSWMNVEIEKGEIRVKLCPLCKAIISYIPRYATILCQTRDYITKVKRKCQGDMGSIEEYQKRVKRIINLEASGLVEAKLKYRSFLKFLQQESSRYLLVPYSEKYDSNSFQSVIFSKVFNRYHCKHSIGFIL